MFSTRHLLVIVLSIVSVCGAFAQDIDKLPIIDSSWARKKLELNDKPFLDVERELIRAWNDKAMHNSILKELEKQAKSTPNNELTVYKWAFLVTFNDNASLVQQAKKALASVSSPINIRTARLLLFIDYWLNDRREGRLRSEAIRVVGREIVKRYSSDKDVIRQVANILSWSDDLEDREDSVRMIKLLAKLEPKRLEILFDVGLYQTYVYEKSVRKSDLLLARDSFVRFVKLMDSSKYIYQTEMNTKMLIRAAKSWIDTLNKALTLKKSFNPERK